MVTIARKRRRPIAVGVMLLLLFNWGSALCADCVRAEKTNGSTHLHNADGAHAHHGAPDGSEPADVHCPGKCDCDQAQIAVAKAPESKFDAGLNPPMRVAIAQSRDIGLSMSAATGASWRPYLSERAVSPPFARYNVLLN